MAVTITTKIRRDGHIYTVAASAGETNEAIAILDDVTGRSTPPAGEYLVVLRKLDIDGPEDFGARSWRVFVSAWFDIVDASLNAIRKLRAFDRFPANFKTGNGYEFKRVNEDHWERVGIPPELAGCVYRVRVGIGGLIKNYIEYVGRIPTPEVN